MHNLGDYPGVNQVMRSLNVMSEIDSVPAVREVISDRKCCFGFISEEALYRHVRSLVALREYGFEIIEIEVPELVYHHPIDDQVVFIDPRPPMSAQRQNPSRYNRENM